MKYLLLIFTLLVANPCHAKTKFILNEFGGGYVSKNGLTARYAGAGTNSFITSNSSVTDAKVYFELTLKTQKGRIKAGTFSNFGITTDPSLASRLGDFDAVSEGSCEDSDGTLVCTYGACNFQNSDQMKDGDVFGVAINTISGRFFFSKNGKWVRGDPNYPNKGKRGREIVTGVKFWAAVSSSAPKGNASDRFSDKWSANFGKRAFKYKIPKGYSRYSAKAVIEDAN